MNIAIQAPHLGRAHIVVKMLKVLSVQFVVHLGDIGWPLRVQLVPIDACEEGVCLHRDMAGDM